jgi:SAM-dependent methyltransferase
MPKPLQAEAALAATPNGERLAPKTVQVVFRSKTGAVGKRDHLTHWIHSYPAKMFHRIPQAILSRLPTQPKIRILDPFCGSGTVLLEAIARGHDATGIDVNPVARLITRVKVTPLCPLHLKRHLPCILRSSRKLKKVQPDAVLDYWFKPGPRQALESLAASIGRLRHDACRDFFLVCLSSIVRKASLADPTVPPPVKLTAARAKIANLRYRMNFRRAQKLDIEGVFALFESAVAQNLRRMDALYSLRDVGSASLVDDHLHAAHCGLEDASVDLVITSPPYCGAQKYVRTVRLELILLGFTSEEIAEADRRTLGTERLTQKQITNNFSGSPLSRRLHKEMLKNNVARANIFAEYATYLDSFAQELSRVLKPAGEAFVTFGTDRVAGVKVDCAKLFTQAAIRHGMTHIATLVDSIPSRGMITNRHVSAATIRDERVVWIRR